MSDATAADRTTGHIRWEWVELQLRATRSIWLATTRRDGRPHTAPVWFVWHDQHVWFITGTASQKGRNLRHQPWVVLSAGDGDDVIVLEGMARRVEAAGPIEAVDAVYSAKYVDPASGARDTVRHADSDLWQVTPVHVMAWMYGNVAGRTDWLFPMSESG